MADFQKVKNFAQKDAYWNVFVVMELLFAASLFIALVCLKMTETEENEDDIDNKVDFLKFVLVWSNVILLGVLLFQKKVLTNGASWMKALFGSLLIALNVAALINFAILIKIRSSMKESEGQATILPYNYDWLTLGITMVTDISYLVFYSIFKSTRAISITVALIFIQIIVFAVCAQNGSDVAVDLANAVLAMVTLSMAIMLWSGQVVLDERGNPSEFKDFFARDDLVEMEVMVSADSMSKA